MDLLTLKIRKKDSLTSPNYYIEFKVLKFTISRKYTWQFFFFKIITKTLCGSN